MVAYQNPCTISHIAYTSIDDMKYKHTLHIIGSFSGESTDHKWIPHHKCIAMQSFDVPVVLA